MSRKWFAQLAAAPCAFALALGLSACSDDEAAADLASGKAHGHFGDCGEFAQNSGPNFTASWLKNATGVLDYYLAK